MALFLCKPVWQHTYMQRLLFSNIELISHFLQVIYQIDIYFVKCILDFSSSIKCTVCQSWSKKKNSLPIQLYALINIADEGIWICWIFKSWNTLFTVIGIYLQSCQKFVYKYDGLPVVISKCKSDVRKLFWTLSLVSYTTWTAILYLLQVWPGPWSKPT